MAGNGHLIDDLFSAVTKCLDFISIASVCSNMNLSRTASEIRELALTNQLIRRKFPCVVPQLLSGVI